jgi:hypothetical protein
MAKINSTSLIITVSQLIKDDQTPTALLSADTVAQLEAIIAELAGDGALVEVQQK